MMDGLKISATALMLLGSAACDLKTESFATEAPPQENKVAQEICRSWQGAVFLPSRKDTEESIDKANQGVLDFEAACQDYVRGEK